MQNVMVVKLNECINNCKNAIIFLEKYNTFWDKVSADIQKEFDNKHVYNKIFLKTKTEFYGNQTTDFPDNKIPNTDTDYACLVTQILLSENTTKYYPQVS